MRSHWENIHHPLTRDGMRWREQGIRLAEDMRKILSVTERLDLLEDKEIIEVHRHIHIPYTKKEKQYTPYD